MGNTALDLPNLPEPSPYAPKGLSVDKMIALRDKGLSFQQIADIMKCSKKNVIQRLEYVGYDQEKIDHYKNNRADILVLDQLRYRSHITNAKLKKASASDLSKMVSFKYNEERTERGLSTENIAYKDYTPQVTDLDNQIRELEARIQGNEQVINTPSEVIQAPPQDDRDTTIHEATE